MLNLIDKSPMDNLTRETYSLPDHVEILQLPSLNQVKLGFQDAQQLRLMRHTAQDSRQTTSKRYPNVQACYQGLS
jgi:hypothetical protein